MSIENQTKQGMEQAVEHLKQELKSLRSSRANPGMLDSVQVEVYGTQMRLKELANITVPEPRQLLITPYDSSNGPAIVKGMEAANLNVRAQVDGAMIRVHIPPMDATTRENIAKQCKKKGEEAKVSVREVRRKHNEMIRKQKADGSLSEDQMKRQEKTIQELTDQYCKKIDTICAEKEKEIRSI